MRTADIRVGVHQFPNLRKTRKNTSTCPVIGCSVPAIVASDQPADGESPLDPPSRHAGVRVISVYATPWHILERAEAALPGERFRLHWLHGHFRRSAGQLPKVLGDVELDPSSMTFGHWGLADRMTGARLWLFAVPPGEVVVALDLGVRCGLAETGELLRDCYHLDVRIDGKTVESVAANVPALRRLKGDVQQEFFPERHQLAVTGPIPGATSEQVIQQVIHGTVSAHPHRSGRPRQTRGMTTRRSAGLLLFRTGRDGAVEVLLGHMGGPFWARRDAGGWSTGGYASGLAAALVFGRIAAEQIAGWTG